LQPSWSRLCYDSSRPARGTTLSQSRALLSAASGSELSVRRRFDAAPSASYKQVCYPSIPALPRLAGRRIVSLTSFATIINLLVSHILYKFPAAAFNCLLAQPLSTSFLFRYPNSSEIPARMVPGLRSRYSNSFVSEYLSTYLHQQHITYNGRISTARFSGACL
jgi:hypothetical protein